MVHDANLTQIITEATRVSSNSKSLIDWILVSHPNRILTSGVLSDCFSDHSIIYCIWKIAAPHLSPKYIKETTLFKNCLFINDSLRINWDRVHLIPNVQSA